MSQFLTCSELKSTWPFLLKCGLKALSSCKVILGICGTEERGGMAERTSLNCLELFLGAAASSNSPLGYWARESREHGVLCKAHSLLPHSFLCLLFLFPKQGTRKRKRNCKAIGLGYKSASGKKEGHLGTHSSSCVHSDSRGKGKNAHSQDCSCSYFSQIKTWPPSLKAQLLNVSSHEYKTI